MNKKEEIANYVEEKIKVNGVAFKDHAFMENRTTPVHRWLPWIAGFSGAFVDSVLAAKLFHKKRTVVRDPFAGVGTTRTQAALRGHHVVLRLTFGHHDQFKSRRGRKKSAWGTLHPGGPLADKVTKPSDKSKEEIEKDVNAYFEINENRFSKFNENIN